MQNPTIRKPQPRSYIIDYKINAPPADFNPHFTVGQNYKKDNYRNSVNSVDINKNEDFHNKFDQKHHDGIQNLRNQMYSHTLKQQSPRLSESQNCNSQQKITKSYLNSNNDLDKEPIYYNYRKQSKFEQAMKQDLIKKGLLTNPQIQKKELSSFLDNSRQSSQKNIFGSEEYHINSQNNFPTSKMNYRSIDYNLINFNSSKLDKSLTKKQVYEPYLGQRDSQNNQFNRGGIFTKYLDERKISTINANPIFNQKYSLGNLDFKKQNGDFSLFVNQNKGYQKPFRKFK